MIISSSITVGQITFIFRVTIQIIGYGGLALIGLLIIGNAPRVGPIDTHDVINRAVGQSTASLTTLKWLFNRIRRNHADPAPQTNLFLILLLFVLYAAFLALSDIGFLGLYACSVPGPSFYDYPASVSSFEAANKSIVGNMVTGTDPSTVALYRCGSTEVWTRANTTFNYCTSWENSTYADRSLFSGLNSTDSDLLMPLRMTYHLSSANPVPFVDTTPVGDQPMLNNFYAGPGSHRVTSAIIQNGILVEPHQEGSRTIIGVPQLSADHKVQLEKTLAFEFEVGCHSIGIFAQHNVDLLGGGVDFIVEDGWEKYSGPDHMKEPLYRAAQKIRDYWRPYFTVPAEGGIIFSNSSDAPFSLASSVRSYSLPKQNTAPSEAPTKEIIGNCTSDLLKVFGIEPQNTNPGAMCGLLGVGSSVQTNGKLAAGFNRMICAGSMQVNMVSAAIAVNADREVSLDYTRLPSDLHTIEADLWSLWQAGNNTTFWIRLDPYVRFTMGNNPQGPTNHYISPIDLPVVDSTTGAGSCGTVVRGMASAILDNSYVSSGGFAALPLLESGFNPINLSPNVTTRWLGEVGASFFLNSLAYKGYSAIDSPVILVDSSGGQAATCYKPAYAFGFLPLVFTAIIVVFWTLIMAVTMGISGYGTLKDSYGGIEPFVSSVYPGAPPTQTLAAWEKGHQPYLQLVRKGETMTGDPQSTALKYFKSNLSY